MLPAYIASLMSGVERATLVGNAFAQFQLQFNVVRAKKVGN